MNIQSPFGLVIALIAILLITRGSLTWPSFRRPTGNTPQQRLFSYESLGDFKTIFLMLVLVTFFGQSTINFDMVSPKRLGELWPSRSHSVATNAPEKQPEKPATPTPPAVTKTAPPPELIKPEKSEAVTKSVGGEEVSVTVSPPPKPKKSFGTKMRPR